MSPASRAWILAAGLVVLPIAAAPLAGSEADSQPCKLALAQGFIEFRRAQFERALQLFEQAQGGSAACVVEARLGKAFTYNGLNDHKKARVEASWVLGSTDDPELLSEAHYQLGLGLHKRGSRMTKAKAAAEAAFLQAVEVSDGEHRGAIRALARLYRETRRDDDLTDLQGRFDNVKVLSRSQQRALMQRPRPAPPVTASVTDSETGDEAEAADDDTEPEGTDPETAPEPAEPGPTQVCEGRTLPDPEQEVLHFGGPDGAEKLGYVKPETIEAPTPQYTESTRRERVQGVVVYELLIGVDGDVLQVSILASLHPELDQSVIDNGCQFRFTPAETPDGEPIPASVSRTTRFSVS